MKKLILDDGSFRDPDAKVAHYNDAIYRVVNQSGFKKFDLIKKLLKDETISKYLIETTEVDQQELDLSEFENQKDIKAC